MKAKTRLKPKLKLLILRDFHPATREKTLELERKARAVIEQENPKEKKADRAKIFIY